MVVCGIKLLACTGKELADTVNAFNHLPRACGTYVLICQALKAVRVRSFRLCFEYRWYHTIISLPVMENSLLVAPDNCAFNPNDHYHLA